MDTFAFVIGGIVGLIVFVWIWRRQTRRLAPLLQFPLWRRSVVTEETAEAVGQQFCDDMVANLRGHAQQRMACALPPKGWCCTREAGHSGPCAALPVVWPVEFDFTIPRLGRTPHTLHADRTELTETAVTYQCRYCSFAASFDPRNMAPDEAIQRFRWHMDARHC